MTTLTIGQDAPNFSALDQEGKEHSLDLYKGSKVVLYFYPKDDTPGCTAQACNLRDNYNVLLEKGYKVLGVSPDGASKHVKFINKYELPFPLLVDEELVLANAYQVYGPKQFMGKKYDGIHRTTFIIDENGKISDIIKKVKTKEHTAQIIG